MERGSSMAHFETCITLPHSREKVFDFLIKTVNLVEMIPADAAMKVVSVPEVLVCGSRLEFEASGFGQTIKIVHEVTELVSPVSMTESQVQGLFKRWVHEHLVELDPAGHAILIDRIEFEPPGGMLGFVVTKKKILENLESMFKHRHRHGFDIVRRYEIATAQGTQGPGGTRHHSC